MTVMLVAFMGPPGSGKGTIAQLFAKKGWVHFSMGQALREHGKGKGKYAKQINRILPTGELVPNIITQTVLLESLSSFKGKKVILDGFPRNMGQIQGVKRVMKKLKTDFSAFVYFDVDNAEILQRLSARVQCAKCGRVYGLHVKPKVKGKCDADKGKLIQRNDDKPSVIKERFKVYREETLPILEWASQKYPVFNINASGAPPIIFKRVQRVLSIVSK